MPVEVDHNLVEVDHIHVEVDHIHVGVDHNSEQVDHNPVGAGCILVRVGYTPVLGGDAHILVGLVENSLKPEEQKEGLEVTSPSLAGSKRKIPSICGTDVS